MVICCGSPRRWTQAHSSTRHRDGPPARPGTAGARAASSPGSHVPPGPHVTGGVDPPGSPGSLPLRILPLHQPARRGGSSSNGCWEQAPAGVGHLGFLDASPAQQRSAPRETYNQKTTVRIKPDSFNTRYRLPWLSLSGWSASSFLFVFLFPRWLASLAWSHTFSSVSACYSAGERRAQGKPASLGVAWKTHG